LTATTGVAAINIGPGCVTVNSAFKFFNEASLRDALEHRPQFIEREVAGYDLIVVDEVSMLSSGILDLIYGFIEKINRGASRPRRTPLKLLLSGDFCQLPPVPDDEVRRSSGGRNAATPFAFKAACWKNVFDPAVTKLTKNYRQASDAKFQQALHYARIGNAGACVANLECEYSTTVDDNFKGLTLYSVNKEVNAHNERKLNELAGTPIEDAPVRWGTQHRDWKEIPDKFVIKLGAQARITANKTPEFEYVNGDIGTVLAYTPGVYARVELHRSVGGLPPVVVDPVTRWNLQSLAKGEEPPTTCNGQKVPCRKDFENDNGTMTQASFIQWKQIYEAYVAAMDRTKMNWYDPKSNKWIIGGITYLPIALGWASTFHRAQGLTVDAIQIDIKDRFSSNPQMMYVALSRARKASSIRITRGDQGKLATRINAHPEVLRFV
jgi:ATP-dependent DNA helicase PIF1